MCVYISNYISRYGDKKDNNWGVHMNILSLSQRLFVVTIILILIVSSVSASKDFSKSKLEDILDINNAKEVASKLFFRPVENSIEDDNYYVKENITIQPVTSNSKNEPGNSLSDYISIEQTGKKVAFHSWSDNLVPLEVIGCNVYLKDIETDAIYIVSEHARFPTMSSDGKYIVYEYEDNFADDIMPFLVLYEVETGETKSITFTTSGQIWSTQTFRIEDSIVYFKTSYQNGDKFVNMTYDIATEKLQVIP